MCGRNFKSGKQRGAMKGGMGENRAYHTLGALSAGKVSRKKRKARKKPSAPSVVRKMRKRKGDASHIAANALTSGKTPKMHDF